MVYRFWMQAWQPHTPTMSLKIFLCVPAGTGKRSICKPSAYNGATERRTVPSVMDRSELGFCRSRLRCLSIESMATEH